MYYFAKSDFVLLLCLCSLFIKLPNYLVVISQGGSKRVVLSFMFLFVKLCIFWSIILINLQLSK